MSRDLAICVATYRRPELLRRLLDSLLAAVRDSTLHAPDVALQVRVVDNDPNGSAAARPSDRDLRGTRLAGEGDVVGRAQILYDPSDIGRLEPGDIVVARFTDPSWYPAFSMARGVVTEVGGWLSHAAIVARECNVTAIVGVGGATEALQSGQMVRLCQDGSVEVLSAGAIG